jgi:hypothetical protein
MKNSEHIFTLIIFHEQELRQKVKHDIIDVQCLFMSRYIQTTISNPNVKSIIQAVSTILHSQMQED